MTVLTYLRSVKPLEEAVWNNSVSTHSKRRLSGNVIEPIILVYVFKIMLFLNDQWSFLDLIKQWYHLIQDRASRQKQPHELA